MKRNLITILSLVTFALYCAAQGQRIVTIQLDGTQYYVSRMNPYSSELNYFLAYQYCRSIGLQLVSFETKEKADAISEYLKNAGYSQYDFWTSGNHMGSNMLLWMSTGLPFNATFNYLRKLEGDEQSIPTGPLPMGRRKRGGPSSGCITLKANDMDWDTEDCSKLKDFICEQTRCYFYNYGSIPVSPAQGNHHRFKERISSTGLPFSTTTVSTTPLTSTTTQSTTLSITATTTPYISSTIATTIPPETHEETETESNVNESEETDNEIDFNNSTEAPTFEYLTATPSNDDSIVEEGEGEEEKPSRSRTTKILESQEENSARNMPEIHGEAFPWAWAKNILLEKPRKTSQT